MYLVDQAVSQSAADHVTDQSDRAGPRVNSRPNNVVCRFFLRGSCRDGQNCRFKHVAREPREPREPLDQELRSETRGNGHNVGQESQQTVGTVGSENVDEELQETQPHKDTRAVKKLQGLSNNPRHCQFFLRGFCRNGRDCRFIHPYGLRNKLRRNEQYVDQPPERRVTPNVTGAEHVSDGTPVKKASVLPNSRQEYILSELTDEVVAELRGIELEQMKKRYPRGTFEGEMCEMTFYPTDPDWPYDVKQVDMVVTLPRNYPVQAMTFAVSDQQNLPITLARHIEVEVSSWLERRHAALAADGKTQLVFRPLLIWLDRQLERIFTEGLTEFKKELIAKKAGLEFVPAWKLRKRGDSQTSTGDTGSGTESASGNSENETSENETGNEESEESEQEELNTELKNAQLEEKQRKSSSIEPERKGTELKLRHLQLQDHAGTLILEKLRLTVQCSRCKTNKDINLRAKRLGSVTCSKCHFVMLVNYRPAMMHEFSDIAGYLDFEGCSALDLIMADCEFTIGCSNCSRDMKKERITPGAVHDARCYSCDGKLRVATESARFFQLQPGDQLDVKKAVPLGGGKKKRRDVLIREGEPLPDEGTCKHYKKSFRWFRFSCCGKVFACDLCHEEKKDDGHDMVWANRQICGHCSHEQPYAPEKPCRMCCHSMTKSTGSAYWEGGKGCRDKIKMSRNDVHKYQNLSKTISKSTQKKSDQQKPRTKPRHT